MLTAQQNQEYRQRQCLLVTSGPQVQMAQDGAKPDSAINQALYRLEAVGKLLQGLDIDFRDRIDTAAAILSAPCPPMPQEPLAGARASNGPLLDRIEDIEMTCQRLAERVAQLRHLLG